MYKIQRLKVKPGQVLSYTLLPGIVPRVKDFSQEGFGWLAHLMALIYAMARLLPPGHPYLNPANKGRFGVRHVIAEAAKNLKFSWKNADQIIIFLALLSGFVLLIMQFVILVWGFVIQPAFAQVFTPGIVPDNDIAFMLLDKIFAIPNLYNSQFDPNVATAIPPFNRGLHALLHFYSIAMLVIAVLILLYYIMVVVAETAQSGTPFGQRFAHVWAPIRLVVALGLLVPINYGLNSAQYIVLYAAKIGSNFGTHAWIMFNDNLATNTTAGSPNALGVNGNAQLIARPKVPDIQGLLRFMSVAVACKKLYEEDSRTASGITKHIRPYLVKDDLAAEVTYAAPLYFDGSYGPPITPPTVNSALGFYGGKNIRIVFGHDGGRAGGGSASMPGVAAADNSEYSSFDGGIEPTCGELSVPVSSSAYLGTQFVAMLYYYYSLYMWDDAELAALGDRVVQKHLKSDALAVAPSIGDKGAGELPDNSFKQDRNNHFQMIFNSGSIVGYAAMTSPAVLDLSVQTDVLNRGWAGAGIWYNKISEWNGALSSAVFNVPSVALMPKVMEEVKELRRAAVKKNSVNDMYNPDVKDGKIELKDGELRFARGLNDVYQYWTVADTLTPAGEKPSGQVLVDIANAIFGLDGLVAMRNSDRIYTAVTGLYAGSTPPPVHPLAQLTAAGKSILDHAIGNLMVALGGSAMHGMLEILDVPGAATAQGISSLYVSFVSIGLTAGFLLYYVLPFLPFIYFFFAVGSWVKTIFEAMVGVPLWALAHLRIDGDGLPGESAVNGYYLILEIFIRPILTVFGLLAGMIVFTAMVRTFNGMFDLVLSNMAGFGDPDPTATNDVLGLSFQRGAIDKFFFTIMYTLVVYMMAMASFKMIDKVPQGILRWFGSSTPSFADDRDDPSQGLVRYAAYSGSSMANQAVGAMAEGARAGGQTAGAVGNLLRSNKTSSTISGS